MVEAEQVRHEGEMPPLAVGIEEAAKLLSVGRTLFLQCDRTGELGPVGYKLGGRRLWSVAELAAWVRYGMPNRARWQEIWKEIRKDS